MERRWIVPCLLIASGPTRVVAAGDLDFEAGFVAFAVDGAHAFIRAGHHQRAASVDTTAAVQLTRVLVRTIDGSFVAGVRSVAVDLAVEALRTLEGLTDARFVADAVDHA